MLAILDRPLMRLGAYGAFGLVVFFVALGLTFPDEQIKDIVTVQLEKQLGGKYAVEVSDLNLWWFTGVSLHNVSIAERVDPTEEPGANAEDEGEAPPGTGPLKVTVPRVAGRLAMARSLIGLAPAIEFEVEFGGGVVEGYVQIGRDSRDIYVAMDRLDLRKTVALTAFTGMPFFGEMSGEIELEMHPQQPTITAGSIKLSGDKLTVGPATIETDKFPPITYLEIPQTNFGTLEVELAVADSDVEADADEPARPSAARGRRQMKINTFNWSGRDIRGDMWGAFKLASRVDQTSADVQMRMQLDEAFVKKNNLGALLNVSEIRKGKNRDWFGLRLYGTLKNIRFKGAPAAAAGPTAEQSEPGSDEP